MDINFLRLSPGDVPYFLGALLVAIAIVFLISRRRFGEPTMEKVPDDPLAQLLPKHLATKEEYSSGLMTYIAAMILLLVALSCLGNPILDLLQIKVGNGAGGTVVAPIVIGLALVGLLANFNVPYVKEIEWHIRHFAHQRAFIPASARATAETLTAAGFDFSQYRHTDVLSEMDGVEAADFDRSPGTILYDWARLNCLLYAVKGRYEADLDGELLKQYEHDLAKIYDRREELVSQIAEFRRKRLESPRHADEQLRRKLKASLWQLYVLVGCAVRLRAGADSYEAWKRFGFVLRPAPARPENRDAMLVGIAVMTVGVFAISYIVFELAQSGVWQSPNLPSKAYEPFIWAVSAALVQGGAIFASNCLRGYLNARDRWFLTRGSVRTNNHANYVKVAIVCGVVGYLLLYLWSLLFQPPTLVMAQSAMPFALLPAATGAFYAFHLDNVELGRRPARSWEVSLQALVTGAVSFVTAEAWLSLQGASMAENWDYLIFMVALGLVIGGSLGWYIPEAVSKSRYDPLNHAKQERLSSLEAMAAKRFENAQRASEWLATPLDVLQNRTPIVAAATIEGYQDAVTLLQRRAPSAAAL
jgi:Protein of unknown function (DUF2384)